MHFAGKKIVVIGMGKTGIATALFLGKQGAKVTVTDEKPFDQWSAEFELIAKEKWLEIGKYNADILADAGMVIPSPGVPPYNDLLVAALKKKITRYQRNRIGLPLFENSINCGNGHQRKNDYDHPIGRNIETFREKNICGRQHRQLL